MSARAGRLALGLLAILVGAPGCVGEDVHDHGGIALGATPWVAGYWVGWQADRYPKEVVSYQAMTHLMLAHARVEPDGRISNALSAPDGVTIYSDGSADAAAKVLDLASRVHAAGRKLIVVVGQEGEAADWRSATSAAHLDTFVGALLAEVDALSADGVDLNWYPFADDPGDVPLLVELARSLKEARPAMLVTFGLPWGAPEGIAAAVPFIDQFNMKTFAMFGTWPGWVSWHFAALRPDAHGLTSLEGSVASAVEAGIPRAKIGVGIGFHGMVFQGPDPPYAEVTAPGMPVVDDAGVPLPGLHYEATDDVFSYANLKRYYVDPNPGAYVWYDDVEMGGLSFPSPGFEPTTFVPADDPAWATGGTEAWRKRVTWVSFEDERSIAAKGVWARAEGIGGTVLWTINEGCLDPATGENPLLGAAQRAFTP